MKIFVAGATGALGRRLPVRRIVAQSYAGPGFYARTGGPVKTEDDPFDPDPPAALRRTVQAVRYLGGPGATRAA